MCNYVKGMSWWSETLFSILFKPPTVTWCEPAHAVSSVISEFFNAMTGLALVASAGAFLLNKRQCDIWLPQLYPVLFWTGFTGVGTFLFHAFPYYLFQICDEFGMFMICLEYQKLALYLLEKNTFPSRKPLLFYRLTHGAAIVFLFGTGYINDQLQVSLFQGTIVLFVIRLIYLKRLIYLSERRRLDDVLYMKYNVNNHTHTTNSLVNAVAKTLKTVLKLKCQSYYPLAATLGATGFILWNIENHYCATLIEREFISFHACWHVLTSVGLYYINSAFLMSLAIV